MDVKEFLAPLVEAGITMEEADVAEIDAGIHNLDENVVSNLISGLNSTLTAGGLLGIAEGQLKKSDVAAEGTLTAEADAALEGVLGKIVGAAKAYAASAAPAPAEVAPTTPAEPPPAT